MGLDYVKNNLLFYVGLMMSTFIIAQSTFFIIKAYKQGLKIGLSKDRLKKVITQSAIFTIVPSLSILLTIITLSRSLGINLPWIRLSVIGAITYEVPAATSAAGVFGYGVGSAINDASAFSTIAWVMTVGSFLPLILIPLFLKKIQGQLDKIKAKDKKMSELITNAIFLGMIASFLGYGIAGSTSNGVVYGSIISILCLLTSAVVMMIIGYLIKVRKILWLENFALPLSMIIAMASAILYYNILPPDLATWLIPGLF